MLRYNRTRAEMLFKKFISEKIRVSLFFNIILSSSCEYLNERTYSAHNFLYVYNVYISKFKLYIIRSIIHFNTFFIHLYRFLSVPLFNEKIGLFYNKIYI